MKRDRLQALAAFELVVFAVALLVQFLPRRGVIELYHPPSGIGPWVATALLLSVAMNVFLAVLGGVVWACMRATGKWEDTGSE